MTTVTMPTGAGMIALPNRDQWRQLLHTPSVIITFTVCGTVLALAAIAGVVFLAYTGNDAAVIGTLITLVLAAVGALLNSRVKRTLDAVQQQKTE